MAQGFNVSPMAAGPQFGHPSANLPGGQLVNTLWGMVGPRVMQGMGMGFGQFQPDQSLPSFQEATSFQRLQRQAGSAAIGAHAPADLQGIFTGLQGMGMFAGGDASAQKTQLSQTMAAMAPGLNMAMPGLADVLGPGMGSAAFAGSMTNIFRPAMQGPDGMSGQTMLGHVAGITKGMHELYAGDGQQMMGIRIGEMGGMLNVAQNLGLGVDMQDLKGLSSEQLSTRFGELGTALAHPMSAVRDMPGSSRLSAPQRFAAAQALTMGGFQRDTMQEMGRDIRRFKALTEQSRMPVGVGLGLMATAGARSVALGGERHLGAMAGRHAIAMAGAAGALGGEKLQRARTSKEMLAQKDALLMAQAGRSTAAAQLAATMQLGEAGAFKKGSRAAKEFAAIKAGGGTFRSSTAWRRMMMQSVRRRRGFDARTISSALGDREANLAKYGKQVASRVREMQWDQDIGSRMIRNISGRLAGRRGRRGRRMTGRRRRYVAAAMTHIMRGSVELSDTELRQKMKKKLRRLGVRRGAAGVAEMSIGAGETVSRRMGAASLREMSALHSHKMLVEVRRRRQQAEESAIEAEKQAAEGQAGPGERAVGAVKTGERGFLRFLARILGGRPGRDKRGIAGKKGEPVPAGVDEALDERGTAGEKGTPVSAGADAVGQPDADDEPDVSTTEVLDILRRLEVTMNKLSLEFEGPSSPTGLPGSITRGVDSGEISI